MVSVDLGRRRSGNQMLHFLSSTFSAVVQAIKDVLQSLVDDDLVDLEKVGIKNFYWAFRSKRLRQVRHVQEPTTGVTASSTFPFLPS